MIRLVKLQREHMPLLIDMMNEWTQAESSITPWAISHGGKHPALRCMIQVVDWCRTAPTLPWMKNGISSSVQ